MTDENFVPYYETFDLAQDFLRDPPDADPVTWQSVLGQTRRPNGTPEAEIALRWARDEYLAMDRAMREYEDLETD
jgi:hypothetical protein